MLNYEDVNSTDFSKKCKEQWVIKDLKLFSDKMGVELFSLFMRGFVACGKLQSNQDLYIINDNYNKDPIANARNSVHLFFRIVSDINEWKETIQNINSYLRKNKMYEKIVNSTELQKLNILTKEISKQKLYNSIRNQIGSHDGDMKLFERAIDIVKNDKFILGECLSDPNDRSSVSSNSVIYNSSILIFKSLNIDDEDLKILMEHTLKITGNGIDEFQKLFYICSEHVEIVYLMERIPIDQRE